MKTKKKFIVLAIVVLMVIAILIPVLFPVVNVNVVFNSCVNKDELATVFYNTSFKSYEVYEIRSDSAGVAMTNNTQLFGTPLEGVLLESALAAEPQSTGIAVVDGCVSLADIAKIKESPFVDNVTIYFRILYGGDREILGESTQRFYENNPETRYWEKDGGALL